MRLVYFIYIFWLCSLHILTLSAQPVDSILLVAQEKLKVAKSSGVSSELADAYETLGMLYVDRHKYGPARENLMASLALIDSIQESDRWVEVTMKVGDLAASMGDFDGGLIIYNSVKGYLQAKERLNDLAQVNRKIGFIHNSRGDFKGAMKFYDRAIGLYKSAPELDTGGIALIYCEKGVAFSRQSDYTQALTFFRRAEGIFDTLNERFSLLYVYNNMSGAYLAQGHYPRALEYLQKTLTISRELKNSQGEIAAISNIGLIYLQEKAYDQALEYLSEGIELARKSGDRPVIARIGKNIGSIYEHLQDTSKALDYFMESLDMREEMGDKQGIASTHLAIGKLRLNQGDLKGAETHFEVGKKLSEEIGDDKGRADTYQLMGQLAFKRKQYNVSTTWCEKGLALADKIGTLSEIESNCLCLIDAYDKLGDFQKVAQFQKRYIATRDSLNNEEKTREMTRLEMQYEFDREKEVLALEQKQKESELKAEVAEQQLIRNVSLIGLLAGLIILILLWRGYLTKQKSNRRLEVQKNHLQQALDDRENLLREIHHRVKNNLQVVSSLLSLQSRTIEDPAALDAIQEGRNRVKAMALIHQNLYQEDNLMGVHLPDYITKLTDSLLNSYKVDTNRISIERKLVAVSLDVDTLIPLGLILNELITNALKYAFSGKEEGIISVETQLIENTLQILVKDNGVGIPHDFDMKRVDTMGFKLVRAFVNKMKAKIDIQSTEGTSIRIFIPANKNASLSPFKVMTS